MTLTIEATYENGVLKPAQPLPLKEHQKVQVTIQPATSWVDRTAGLCKFAGSIEDADRFASDVDLDYPPPREGP